MSLGSINKMKMMSVMLLVIGMFLVVAPMVHSEQAITQTNKILLTPQYTQSMSSNTNYTFTLVVDTPDGLSSVDTAMVTFNVWMTPTVNYYLWVNGQPCNNPSYQIHTTYAGSGNSQPTFECSNIIDKAGTYNITFNGDKNSGASTGWIDLTYTNSPRPKMVFGGTDYFSFEPNQLVFVQLIDNTASGNPIDNAICFADVYSSDGFSDIIDYAPMVHTEHGLYHLHTAITEVGVHMVAVECFYQFNNTIYNVSGTTTTNGNYQRLTGTVPYQFFYYSGSTTNYTSTVSTLGGTTGELNVDGSGGRWVIINSTSTFQNGDTIKVYASATNLKRYDYSNLAGTISYGSFTPTSTGYQWYNVTLSNTGGGVTQLYLSDLFSGAGGSAKINFDYVVTTSLTGGGWFGNPDTNNTLSHLNLNDNLYWQIVESSGDLLDVEFSFSGLTGLYNDTANLDLSAIWTGTENLNISAYNVTSASWVQLPNKITTSIGETDYNNVLNSFSNYVNASGVFRVRIQDTLVDIDYGLLKIDNLNLEIYEGQGAFVDDVKGGGEVHIINASGITQDVWSAPDRQLTELNFDTTDEEAIWDYQGNVSTNLLNQFAGAFWNWTGSISTTIGNFISNVVWTAPDRNLTYYEDTTNYTLIGDLIVTNSNNLSAQDIWEYANRTLTDYNHTAQFDLTNYTLVQNLISQYGNDLTAELVWNYSTRNLTFYPAQVDLTNYTLVEDLINQYSNNLSAGEIWNYANRNLTYYADPTNYTLIGDLITALGNNNTDLTNYTLVGDLITQLGNEDNTNYTLVQNIVTQYGNDDNSNYTLIQDLVTQYGNNNTDLTNYTLVAELVYNFGNEDNTNYTLISDMVWSATTRTLTAFNFTVDVNQTLIANAVWSAVNRTLTETQFTDTTNYTLIQDLITSYGNNLTANDIWQYGARNLTYYPVQTDLTNYTLINQGVWAYYNRTLTYYEVANPNNLTAQEIWEYANRNLTYYPVQVDLTNYTLVGDSVWNALNRTLSDFNFTVTINNSELVGEVWSYYNRTLTETADPFNYSYMQGLVWNFTDRELTNIDWSGFNVTVNTTVPAQVDLTNYNLIQDMVWNATTRELTYYPTVNLTLSNDSIQAIGDAVWQYNGTINSNILNQVAENVQCYLSNLLEVNNEEWAIDIKSC